MDNLSFATGNHLVKAGEPLAGTLLTAHNVVTMNRLMAEIRDALTTDTLDAVAAAWLADDGDGPTAPADP